MIKVLHSADDHADYNIEKWLKSNEFRFQYIKDNNIDLMIHSGDLFDGRVYADEEYRLIINEFSKIAEYCPIFIIYGTPSHDYKGSLDILEKLNTKYNIVIGKQDTIYLYNHKNILPVSGTDLVPELILYSLPYPTKTRWLSGEELKLSLKEQEELYQNKFNNWIKERKAYKHNNNCPVILNAHLQLKGFNGTPSQDLTSEYQNPELFYDICDYGALGHLHNHHNIENLYYSGSITNKTYGELEDKYFNVLNIEGKDVEVNSIKIPTPKKIKIECTLEEFKIYEKSFNNDVIKIGDIELNNSAEYDLWFVVNISDSRYRKEISDKLFLKRDIIKTVRIDTNLIKTDGIKRDADYNIGSTDVDKFINWCEYKKVKPSEFQINKIKEMENKL